MQPAPVGPLQIRACLARAREQGAARLGWPEAAAAATRDGSGRRAGRETAAPGRAGRGRGGRRRITSRGGRGAPSPSCLVRRRSRVPAPELTSGCPRGREKSFFLAPPPRAKEEKTSCCGPTETLRPAARADTGCARVPAPCRGRDCPI